MNMTLEDALALCGLTEEEVLAIAEHEHIEEMPAVAMGSDLLNSDGGAAKIARFIVDDIENAQANNRDAHAAALKVVLRHFIESHMS